MKKTIVRQFLTTIYSDGSSNVKDITFKRDSLGRFATKSDKPKQKKPQRKLIDPDDIPGLDEHGNVTRRVTCPDCGLVFMRSFKILGSRTK